MFSGIIEQVGQVKNFKKSKKQNDLSVNINLSEISLNIGDSVAVNGVCLTVSKMTTDKCHFDISPETLSITAIGNLNTDDEVNIEFPLTLNKFISGHITTGHIDSVGTVKSIINVADSWEVQVTLDQSTLKYIIFKGSITLDGVSLTVNKLIDNVVYLMIIPHTYKNTIFRNYKNGQKVNIEVDYITKHIEKLKK